MRQLLTPPDTKNEKNAVGDKDWKRIPLNNAMPQNLRGLNSCYKTITIYKMKTKVKENKSRSRHNVEGSFLCVLYFGWPNQPSSGIMIILHWYVIFMLHVV